MATSDATIAHRLALMGAGFRLASCPEPVVRQARKVLVDNLGCMLAGARAPLVERLLEVVGHDGAGPCTLPGRSERLGPLEAALVNGTSGHALELDDGHTPGSAHPGSVIVPAALAVAEREQGSLGQVLEAVIVGYEVMLTAASAVHPESRRRGFHNTAVAGGFGAAAAAAKLLGLDPAATRDALGLAGSFAGGLLAFWNPGEYGATDIKKIHPGKAARDGVFCALCAARGIRGPASVFEGRAGFYNAYGKGGEAAPETGSIERPKIMDVYFKPWPCCRSLHGPVALALGLRPAIGDQLERIDAIRVETYSLAAERSRKEAPGDDAHFSIPLTVALALHDGALTYQTLAGAAARETVRRLAAKVEVVEDSEFTRRYPGARAARLTVTLQDGRVLSDALDHPPGEPQEPLPDGLLIEKFLAGSAISIEAGAAHRVLKLLLTADPDLPMSELSPLVTPIRHNIRAAPGSTT